MKTETGRILKGIGGFYYVRTPSGVVECKARGRFRKAEGKPVIGDRVTVELQDDGTGYMMSIEPRRNQLMRPAVANVDQIVVVCCAAPPKTETLLIDKVTAIAAHKGIEALVVINKCDLDAGDRLHQIYTQAGFSVFRVSAETGEGVAALRAALAGRVSAFAGNSGVGKSSLLNCIDPDFQMKTGAISPKTARGRHTTRHVELVELPDGGYIADTPGFSAFDTEKMDLILKEDLQYAFREFEPYLNQCRFTGCAHVKETGCAVRAAVEAGDIPRERHESYCKLYESVRDLKEWKLK
ncbi:MAG TPA: ribosome small subunit-dependent GTPase A [Candidatus Butyricicoccus stercorigallinarum]|nr:ribosome small subunit-dependent GTPase A [Candidatus Butyricicoccus stercorigallinarum]